VVGVSFIAWVSTPLDAFIAKALFLFPSIEKTKYHIHYHHVVYDIKTYKLFNLISQIVINLMITFVISVLTLIVLLLEVFVSLF
jgi:hypothetical protein